MSETSVEVLRTVQSPQGATAVEGTDRQPRHSHRGGPVAEDLRGGKLRLVPGQVPGSTAGLGRVVMLSPSLIRMSAAGRIAFATLWAAVIWAATLMVI